MCSTIWAYHFVTMATYWVPDLPDIKGFAGHLWRSVLILANGASSAWSCQHIKILGWVCGLGKCISSLRSPKYWNQVGGDWKRVSCHGNQFLYSRRCVAFRTISSSSFNGLCCKLTEIALYSWCSIALGEWRHQPSHLHILHIFQT